MRKTRPVEDRFWEKVDKSGPVVPGMESNCWIWTGGKNKRGYGHILINRRKVRAHRLSLELAGGPLLEGECALHRCDNPSCVRPDHLFRGSHADNMADMARKGRAFVQAADSHWSKRKPWLVQAGAKHWSKRTPERCPWGERLPQHKVSAEQATAIRVRYAAGGISQSALANEYGISQVQVGNIVRGKSWRRLKTEAA